MKRRIHQFAFKTMSKSLPFSTTSLVYTPAATPLPRQITVRGAGKWTWVLLEAVNTLNNGGEVWIQAGASELGGMLASQIQEGVEKGIYPTESGYEKKWPFSPHPLPAFGDYSLAATVGLWFQSAGAEAANLLSPFISTEGFTFTPKEFIDLRERLQTAIRRYERMPDVSRGLEDLNTGFFRHRTLAESKEFISDCLITYLEVGDNLHRDFLMTINRYTRRAIFSERAHFQERQREVNSILAVQHSLEGVSGRAAKSNRREVEQRWQKYCQKHQLTVTPTKPPAVQLSQELAALERRQSRLFRDLQSASLGLNALTANSKFVDPAVLKHLETRLTDLIREVDEAGLYQLPLGRTEVATTHRQILRLEDLLNKLRNTKRHLPELPDFYDRRHFWYAQPAHLRRLLAPLLDLPTTDWETAFSSWYFDRCIEKWTRENLPVSEERKPEKTSRSNTSFQPGQIRLVTEETVAKDVSEQDLFIVLDGDLSDLSSLPCPVIRPVPLHSNDAVFFAVAGLRDPTLLFSQTFSPLTPPVWRARNSSGPPPGFPAGTILCQVAKEAQWIPISKWPLKGTSVLHIFLPVSPCLTDARKLLQVWEYLVATSEEITFFHSWTSSDITQALLSDGFTATFLSAALLRAAEAAEIEPFDRQALVAIGQEIQLRCELALPSPHPLAENFGEKLKSQLPTHFFEVHQPWRDTFLPLVILSPAGKKSVLLPDGKLPGYGSARTENSRLLELKTAGFHLISLPAAAIWANPKGELMRIAAEIRNIS